MLEADTFFLMRLNFKKMRKDMGSNGDGFPRLT
jgi:hypothetical protein